MTEPEGHGGAMTEPTNAWDDTVARIKRDVEREMLEKELQPLRHGGDLGA
jgi:hypothetical protein